MKKLLGIVVLGLLMSGNAYSLECNLVKDKLLKNGELLDVDIYNPNDMPVDITGINYYNGSNLLREYNIYYLVHGKKNIRFSHRTNIEFLKKVNKIDINCKIWGQ